MKIKFNKKFENLVGKDFILDSIMPCSSNISFKDSEDIVQVEDCFYFKKFTLQGKLSDSINKMEYEFDNNCLRVDDLTDKKITEKEAFWCGLSLIKDLIFKLQIKFGTGFEVILTYNYRHCYVRFYKIRNGVNNVMSNDLEGFKNDAILRVKI